MNDHPDKGRCAPTNGAGNVPALDGGEPEIPGAEIGQATPPAPGGAGVAENPEPLPPVAILADMERAVQLLVKYPVDVLEAEVLLVEKEVERARVKDPERYARDEKSLTAALGTAWAVLEFRRKIHDIYTQFQNGKSLAAFQGEGK